MPTPASDPSATGPPPAGEGAGSVVARPPEFPQFDERPVASGGTTLDALAAVPITLTAQLGHAVLPIAEILKLGPGAVVELNEVVTQPVELTVRGVPFATGEVVVVDGHFAVRIKRLLAPTAGGRDEK